MGGGTGGSLFLSLGERSLSSFIGKFQLRHKIKLDTGNDPDPEHKGSPCREHSALTPTELPLLARSWAVLTGTPHAESDGCAAPPAANHCVWCTASRYRGRMQASSQSLDIAVSRPSTGQRPRLQDGARVHESDWWACLGRARWSGVLLTWGGTTYVTDWNEDHWFLITNHLSGCIQGCTEANQEPRRGDMPSGRDSVGMGESA